MDIVYKRDADSSYMVIAGEDIMEGFERQVLMNNEISCLLSYYKVVDNNQNQFWYDISGAKSLKDHFLQQGLSVDSLCKMLLYLKLAYDEIGKYLIKQEHIMLGEETIYIYQSAEEYRVLLTYYPSLELDVCEQVGRVFEFLISIVDHEKEDIMTLVYRLYEMNVSGATLNEIVDEASNYTYEQYCQPLEEPVKKDISKRVEEDFELQAMPVEGGLKDKVRAYISSAFAKVIDLIKKKYRELFPKKREGYDFVFEPDQVIEEPTVLISTATKGLEGRLLYEGESAESDFYIRGESFSIGTSDKNDGVINTNTVSRFHGVIERDSQGEFFLSDLNSTNGTFLNGQAVPYKGRAKLSQMDEIMFADVCYRIV